MKRLFAKNRSAKIFITFLFLTLLVLPTAVLAQAAPELIPGFKPLPIDKTPAVPTSDAAIRTKTVGLTIAGQTVEGLTLDSLATAFVRGILTELTNQTIKWINSGFQGSPQYATDLKGYIQNEADATAGYVIDSEVPGLCSPFTTVVKEALVTAQSHQTSAVSSSCTLSQVSSNINNFMNGDFIGSGGWPAWFTMTQDPYGNPYSSFLNVQAEVDAKTEAAVTNQTQQLQWNQGFLSTQDCTDYIDDADASSPVQTLAPGDKLPNGAICVAYGPVKTPGSVIATQLDKVLGSETDDLNLSTDFNDIVLALTGELQSIVFNSAKGIFDNNPYSNSYSGSNGSNGAGSGAGASCSPSSDTYIIGSPAIEWSIGGITNNSTTYQWTGTDFGLNGTTTANPTIAYTTEGAKTASVTVTQSLDGGLSTTTTTEGCSDTVTVSKYPPLQLAACSITDEDNNPVPGRIKPGTTLIWTIQVTGGSGLLNVINIDEGASLNITGQNTGSTNFDNPSDIAKDILQWNFTADMSNTSPSGAANDVGVLPHTLVAFTPFALRGYWTAFTGPENPQFEFVGDPLPLTKDPSSNTISFTIPVAYTQTGSWPMKFDEIIDHDTNVPILSGPSCPQSVTVNNN